MMEEDRLKGPFQNEDIQFPGLPGRAGVQWTLLAMVIALVCTDAVFWHGLLFNSRIWHVFLWGMSLGGLAIGGLAYWRRERR
jgi:hypothetical protein